MRATILTFLLAAGGGVTLVASAGWPMRGGNPANTGAAWAPSIAQPLRLWSRFASSSGRRVSVTSDGTAFVAGADWQGFGVLAYKPQGVEWWHSTALNDTYAVSGQAVIDSRGNVYAPVKATSSAPLLPYQVVALDAADGHLLWNYTVAGGLASLVLGPDDATLYAGTNTTVYALSTSGSLLWSWTGPVAIKTVPTVAEGALYIAAGSDLYALSARTGALLWVHPFPEAYAPWMMPAAVGPSGTVYVAVDNWLVALSPAGVVQWMRAAGNLIHDAPAVGPDGRVYVSTAVGVVAFAADGTLLWSYVPATGAIADQPVVAAPDNTVYVVAGSVKGQLLIAIDANGHELWTYASGCSSSGGLALGDDGTLYRACGDPNLGGRQRGWLEAVRGAMRPSPTPLPSPPPPPSWTAQPAAPVTVIVTLPALVIFGCVAGGVAVVALAAAVAVLAHRRLRARASAPYAELELQQRATAA